MTSIQPYEEHPLVSIPLEPAEQVGLATRQADALRDVVDQQGLFTMIQGKKFPRAEAWQTIVALDCASFETVYCEACTDEDGVCEGYEAKVNITKNGVLQATGIMVCGFDDFPCKGKTGYARRRAAMSAAQTWAGAKAARMKYAWVMTLAGYEPTPAEEMIQDAPQRTVTAVQAPPRPAPPTRPQRPAPKSSEGKMDQVNQARLDPDGNEIYTTEDVLNYIAANYAGQTWRDLTDADLDVIIEALLAGRVESSVSDTIEV